MKKITALFLAASLGVLLPYACGAEDDNSPNVESPAVSYGEGAAPAVEIPPGMEMRDIGNMHVIVPQGMRVRKKGSLMEMEGSDEFAARNFKEMDTRFAKIEAAQNDLKKTVDDLKREVAELRKE